MEITGKEKLSSLRHKLKAEMIKHKAGSNEASYAVMFEDGYWRLQVDDVCFFRSRYQSNLDEKNTDKREVKELVLSLIPGYKAGAKYEFVNYILTRSIFKDMFLTKSPKAAWRYGVQMDVDANYSQVMAAMIAVRESWEFPHIADIWKILCKKGINEHVAWVCAHAVKPYNENFCATYSDEHQCIGRLFTQDVKDLLKKGMLGDKNDSLAKGATTYQVFKATRSLDRKGSDIRTIIMDGAKVMKDGWSKTLIVSEETLLENVKLIEKELLL